MYALLDCNNFYASCERAFNPILEGKPVCVLSNNDGCVIARSSEVKNLGVPMGAPAFKNKEVFKKYSVQVFSANFVLYGDLSNRVMNICKRYCNHVEVYSIDEAFLQFKNAEEAEKICGELRQFIMQGVGIPTSIGIAPTKTLAKVANRIAKKFPEQTQHVYTIETEEDRRKALQWLKVEDIWGVGRRLALFFHENGVRKAADLYRLPESVIRKKMGIVGTRLLRELEGTPQIGLAYFPTKKSIATTRTFEKPIPDFDYVQERIATFAFSCSEKLRKQNTNCQYVTVFLKTDKYKKNLVQYRNSVTVTLPVATNSAIEITKAAKRALKKIYKPRFFYKKAGVIVSGITPQDIRQTHLFYEDVHEKHQNLMKTIDYLNDKYHKNQVKLAGQDLERTWKMNQKHLSNRYTTDINEIITVKA